MLHPLTLPKLLEVGRSLATELDLDPLLEQVLEVARDVSGAGFAAIGVMDLSRSVTERFLTSGADQDEAGAFPRALELLGLVSDVEPHALRLPDISAHPDTRGFPLDYPPMSSFLGVPILIQREPWGTLYLCDKNEGLFTAADEEAMEVLAEWAAIAIAKARLDELARGRRTELERATGALETTTQITASTDGDIALDHVLDLVADQGRRLIDASSLLVALTAQDRIEVVSAAGDDGHDSPIIGRPPPVDGELVERVLRTRTTERFASCEQSGTPDDPGGSRVGMVVPLVFRGRALGVLVAFDGETRSSAFSDEAKRLLQAFAAAAATAVATAQHVEAQVLQRIWRASEDERRRWARELHDDTLQELAGMRLHLAAAQRTDSLETARGIVADVMERSATAIENLSGLIAEVRPAALDDIGVSAALEVLGQRVARTSGVAINMRVELDDEVARYPTEVEDTVYRLVQEALTNVVKHANATSVDVAVLARDGQITIEIRDDGRGFAAQPHTDGFGLIGMRERAGLIGGRLEITSTVGGGTTVLGRLPGRSASKPDASVARMRA